MKAFFKNNKRIIKYSYITLVIILILFSIFSMSKQIKTSDIFASFSHLTLFKSFTLIFLGILSIVPMIVYDYEYSKQIRNKLHPLNILVNGYMINTITNIAGGGGVIGGSLRTYLFGPVKNTKETIIKVSQIALFTLSGLSTNSIIAVFICYFFNIKISLYSCAILLGSFIYLLILIYFSRKIMNINEIIHLLIGSFFEWFCCFSFFLFIGISLNYNFSLVNIYTQLVIASIVGILSFIPGGLGSFDSIIIFEMQQNNINMNNAVTWVLIYRICYYLIPFLLGITMFSAKKLIKKHSNH